MITEGVRKLLLAQSSVTDLVSTRIYVSTAPQGTPRPYIVIDCDEDEHNQTLEGQLADAGALFFADVTVECWHDTPSKANDIGEVVWRFLDDFTGATGGDETIEAVIFVNRLNDSMDPQSGQDYQLCVNELRFSIHYRP